MEFEQVSAEASTTYPTQASSLRKGGFVVISNRPCKVVEMSTSKTGKHGHAKVHIVAIDIFTQKKLELVVPSTHNVDVPIVKRDEYQLLDISDDDFVSLMLDNGETKDDLKLNDNETCQNLRTLFENGKSLLVTVLSAMNEEMIISFKESQ